MEFTDEKVLHRSEHGEIALVTDENGNEYVRKTGKFSAEALSTILKIDSPYIAKIESYSESQVIMEYISGKPLLEISLPQEQLFEVICEICKGLAALHSAGVIHRDIKPSNIMLADDGHIRIIDFDAARVKKPGADKDTSFIGTDGFAPPEQYGFTQTDERSDIYALGVTIKLLLRDKYENSRFWTVAEKCMRFDPDKRYKSVDQVANALKCRQHKTAIIICSAVLLAAAAFTGAMLSLNVKNDIPVSEPVINIIETTTSASTDISIVPVTQTSGTVTTTTTTIAETVNDETYSEATTIQTTDEQSETADTKTMLTTSETTTASETITTTSQQETVSESSMTEENEVIDLPFVPEGFPALPGGITNVDDTEHVKKIEWEQLGKDEANAFIKSITEWFDDRAEIDDRTTRIGRTIQWKCSDKNIYNGYIILLYVEDTEKNSMFPQCRLSFSEIEAG